VCHRPLRSEVQGSQWRSLDALRWRPAAPPGPALRRQKLLGRALARPNARELPRRSRFCGSVPDWMPGLDRRPGSRIKPPRSLMPFCMRHTDRAHAISLFSDCFFAFAVIALGPWPPNPSACLGRLRGPLTSCGLAIDASQAGIAHGWSSRAGHDCASIQRGPSGPQAIL